VPAIGPYTLHVMYASGCHVLAVEAGCTLLIERAQLEGLAKKYGLCVFGVRLEHQG